MVDPESRRTGAPRAFGRVPAAARVPEDRSDGPDTAVTDVARFPSGTGGAGSDGRVRSPGDAAPRGPRTDSAVGRRDGDGRERRPERSGCE